MKSRGRIFSVGDSSEGNQQTKLTFCSSNTLYTQLPNISSPNGDHTSGLETGSSSSSSSCLVLLVVCKQQMSTLLPPPGTEYCRISQSSWYCTYCRCSFCVFSYHPLMSTLLFEPGTPVFLHIPQLAQTI